MMEGGTQMSSLEIVLSVFGTVSLLVNGWVLFAVRSYREDIERLRKADHDLRDSLQTVMLAMTEKMGAIQLLVAGNYITKEEFRLGINELVHKIDTLSRNLASVGKEQ